MKDVMTPQCSVPAGYRSLFKVLHIKKVRSRKVGLSEGQGEMGYVDHI